MDRRGFLAGAGAAAGGAIIGGASGHRARRRSPRDERLSMRFAPHFGMFRHHAGDDLVAQLEFASDAGFGAWEDNGMQSRPAEDQRRIGDAMERLGIRMGVFVLNPATAWTPALARGVRDDRERFVRECRDAVEVAKRVGATWMTVVPGTRDQRLDLGYQTANAIEALRAGAAALEPHGLVMVLEPLNPRDHPGMLLAKMSHAYELCRGVDSSACKILDDLYHQQVTEGNLIPNIDRAWDEIAYFQIGDNPGRNEPTTGEINFRNVFAHIREKGFAGILGMEHGLSSSGRAGERALIEAYRSVDPA